MAHLFLPLTQSQHHFFLDGCGGECSNLPYQNSSVSAAQLPNIDAAKPQLVTARS